MPDEDSNFGRSLVLDFRKWWRHVLPKNLWSDNQIRVILRAAYDVRAVCDVSSKDVLEELG